MGKRPLNLPFLGLQALLILIDCIAVAYVSPILVSFGYSPMRIGRVMTLAALAATLARPVWGYLNDHFACARQVTLLATVACCAEGVELRRAGVRMPILCMGVTPAQQ